MTKRTGTREWAKKNVNCVQGCAYRCRYCYARANALRFKRITDPREWGTAYHRVNQAEVSRRRRKHAGRVMFPTTHDITPEFLEPCLTVAGKLLGAGNELLIVSKPNMDCIARICSRYAKFRPQILFRFSIGTIDDGLLKYWEPYAPPFDERMDCLRLAASLGFGTSVSCEPLLDADRAVALFCTVEPFVTETIWIGKMNRVRQRVLPGTAEEAIRRIEAGQTPGRIREIYAALDDQPKVRWKDSYRAVLGLESSQ